MPITQSKETISGRNESTTVAEYAQENGVTLSSQELQKHGKEILTKKQKALLQEGQSSLGDIIRFDLDHLSSNIDTSGVEKAINKSGEAFKAGDIEAKNALAEIESEMDTLTQSTNDGAKEKVKEKLKEVKEKGTDFLQFDGIHALVEQLKNSDSMWDNLLGFLLGIFALAIPKPETTQQVAETAEQIATPEGRKETLQKLQKSIPDFSKKIQSDLGIEHPLIDQKINTLFLDPNIMNDQELEQIISRVQAGEELNFNLIKNVTGENTALTASLHQLKDDPEIKSALLLKFQKQFSDHIANEYGFTLNLEKRKDLANIIDKYSGDFEFGEIFQRFGNGETIYIGDIMIGLFKDGKKATSFNMELITSGIIGISNLSYHLAEKGGDLIQFSLEKIGITGEMTIDNFAQQLENMGETEKTIFLALMYRKGGIAFEILGKILGFASKTAFDVIAPASISLKDEFKNFLGNSQNQINTYQKLHNIVGGSPDILVLQAQKQLKQIATQTEIANILETAEKFRYDNKQIHSALEELARNTNFSSDIVHNVLKSNFDSQVNIGELRKDIASKSITKTEILTFDDVAKGIIPGKHQFAQEFTRSINNIENFQQERILNGKWGTQLRKASAGIRASFEQFNITQSFDKLVYETSDIKGVSKSLKEIRKFATQFPEQTKVMFGSIGEIALLGVGIASLQEDESTWNEIFTSLQYMTGIFGSGMMAFSLGGAYNSETGEVDIMNAAIGTAGAGLLVYDLARASKILYCDPKNALKLIARDIILRPITNLGKGLMYSGKGIANATTALPATARYLHQLGKDVASKQFNWSKFGMEVFQKMKDKKGKLALLVGACAVITGGTAYAFETDISGEYEEMLEQGIIDEKGNIVDKLKAKKYFDQEFNESEKEIFFTMILENNDILEFGKHVSIDHISEDTIYLETHTQGIEGWCIEPSQRQLLQDFGYDVQFV